MGTPFLFRCPNTGQTVQGWTAKEPAPNEYIAVTCNACARVHLVNPATEKVMRVARPSGDRLDSRAFRDAEWSSAGGRYD